MRACDRSQRVYFNRPFAGAIGAALYVGYDNPDPGPTSIAYRRNRVYDASPFVRLEELDPGSDETKTLAVAFTNDEEFDYEVPEAMYDSFVWFQLRTHQDDVENTTLWRPRMVYIDADGNAATEILGVATLTNSEKRDGGKWRFQFRYSPRRDGLQPLQYVLHRTAGPTSPTDVTITANQGGGEHTIDTGTLQNAGSYTFQIIAKNDTVETVLLTATITADAAGPAAPTNVEIAEY